MKTDRKDIAFSFSLGHWSVLSGFSRRLETENSTQSVRIESDVRKIRRDSTKQIRVIHPGLNNIRFEFDNLLHDSPDETGLRQAAAHAKYLYLRTGGSNLSAQGIMTGEHDHPMFGAVAIRHADQSQEQHFRAAHAESGNDVENLHVPA